MILAQVFVIVLTLLAAAAQPPVEQTIGAAAARLQAQDPAGAARILEAVTAREPANFRAWRLLGVAYQRAKEVDKALTAASDFSNAAKGPSTGRIYVHSGADGRRLLTLTGETAGEGFGIGPAAAGDVDGDGYDDLIVGAWQYGGEAVSGGRAYLYSGKDGTRLKTYTCRTPGDTFGFDAVGMGDVDGDGSIDFLITSAWSGIHGFHSGRMFIVSSGISRRARNPAR